MLKTNKQQRDRNTVRLEIHRPGCGAGYFSSTCRFAAAWRCPRARCKAVLFHAVTAGARGCCLLRSGNIP